MRFRSVIFIAAIALLGAPLGAAESGVLDIQHIPRLDALAGSWQNAAGERSLPALNNLAGSAQAVPNVLALGKLSFPPLTMAGDTGSLSINGQPVAASSMRWYPYQVRRIGWAGHLEVSTAERLPYHATGVLFHVTVANRGAATETFQLAIALQADTSSHPHWAWSVPRPRHPQRFVVSTSSDPRTVLLRDDADQLVNVFCFAHRPDTFAPATRPGSAQAQWRITLGPGATASIDYVLALGSTGDDAAAGAEHVVRQAQSWAGDFNRSFALVKSEWQARFDAMFTPGNPDFSGHLPVLTTTDPALRRVYYMSAISVLSVLRTHFPAAPRVYVSNSPESNCTMMYFWDTREFATILSLLDPAMLKSYLTAWLSKGIYKGYAEEYLTGTLRGRWYSANDYSLFVLLNAYLNVTGDRAFLSAKIGNQTVLEHMDAIATHWESLVHPGRKLADYGRAGNLLECVPTYINEVASFNAADVWMMQRVARYEEALGHARRAVELNSSAKQLLSQVLALYVPGEGVWLARHENGTCVQVRHVFDFATISQTIPAALTPTMRRDMTDFVEGELLTAHWMRAQSLSDPAAGVSDRPDHGPMGAYSAWPAETVAAFGKLGEYGRALDVIHRCAAATYEGPFSQSRELLGRSFDAPVRIAERGAKGRPTQTFNASNGGAFAESIVGELFGYQPDCLTGTVLKDTRPRGFDGELSGLWQGGKSFNLVSNVAGIQRHDRRSR